MAVLAAASPSTSSAAETATTPPTHSETPASPLPSAPPPPPPPPPTIHFGSHFSSSPQHQISDLLQQPERDTLSSGSNFVVNEFIQKDEGNHSPLELTMSTVFKNMKVEDKVDCLPLPQDSQSQDESSSVTTACGKEMPPPPTPVVSAPSPSQVFAPRPVRPPWPVIYRPIPQRLQKSLVILEDSPIPRTPSPNRVTSPVSPTSSIGVSTSVGGGLVQAAAAMHRRSSSASIVGSDAGVTTAAWNMMSMKLTEPRLSGGETSEVQVIVNEENVKDRGEKEGMDNLVQLYSPSKDVLDELYKIMRNNKSYPLNFNPLSTTSPLYRATSPLVPRAITPQTRRERGLSDSPSPLRELTRSPAEWAGKIPFPSSPISRTAMRNPIIYNPQFAQAAEQLGGLATS